MKKSVDDMSYSMHIEAEQIRLLKEIRSENKNPMTNGSALTHGSATKYAVFISPQTNDNQINKSNESSNQQIGSDQRIGSDQNGENVDCSDDPDFCVGDMISDQLDDQILQKVKEPIRSSFFGTTDHKKTQNTEQFFDESSIQTDNTSQKDHNIKTSKIEHPISKIPSIPKLSNIVSTGTNLGTNRGANIIGNVAQSLSMISSSISGALNPAKEQTTNPAKKSDPINIKTTVSNATVESYFGNTNLIKIKEASMQQSDGEKKQNDIISKLGTSPHHDETVRKMANRLNKINIESRRISKWVGDESVIKCFKCAVEFSLILRRHHCRLCGRVFCYQCSNYFTKLPLDILNKIPNRPSGYIDIIWGEDINNEVRVCGNCFSQASKLIRIRKIIKVFELCKFDIRDLYLLSKLSPDWDDATKFCLSTFREVQYKLSIEDLTPDEKKLLWINRNYLTGHSRWMVQLVKATNLSDDRKVMILDQLLYGKRVNLCWDTMCTRFCSETIGITDMLDLIRYNKNYPTISNFIFKCLIRIDANNLKNYLPFLVCNISNNEFIIDILIDKGIEDLNLMNNIYWCIKVYCNNPESRTQYITKTLTAIKKRTTREFKDRFKEIIGMEKIDIKWIGILNTKKRIILPICPNKIFSKVNEQNVKIMSSYSQPAIIQFFDEYNVGKRIMFKNDDVRKDYIILNIIDIIHTILKNEENLDIEMVKYCVMPTSRSTGYIEIVENADTVFNIIENSGLTIQNYILNNNRNLTIGSFRDKFIKSTALYCIMSYLLGFGDRNLDNIMISKTGLLFHIDFSFILGQDPKYTTNKQLRVTPEIVNVIGGYGTDDYNYFKKLCVLIYNRLRLHVNLFSNLLSILPSIDPTITHEDIKRELTERFEIGENCIEAATHMDNKVESKNNFEYMIIDFLYRSKQNSLFKGISYVTDSLKNMLGK
jgi:hypothetical protein